MKLPYVRFGMFYRPVIPVVLVYKNNRFPYQVFLDTGADFSILPGNIADFLDITLSSSSKIAFNGVTGKGAGYINHLCLEIDELKFDNIPIVFSRGLGPLTYGILGHEGLFDKIKLTFDFHQKEIEISPTNPAQVFKARHNPSGDGHIK